MQKTIELQPLQCAGCAVTIRTALDLNGFSNVKVNLLQRPHSVSADINNESELTLLKSILREHGYPLLEDSL